MSLNLAFILDEALRTHPDQTAVIIEDFRMTYAQLADATMRVAALLRAKGIKPGDKVALLLPNVPQFTIAYYGILRLGAAAVTLNVLSVGDEVAYYLEDSDAKILIAWHGFAEAANAGFSRVDTCRELLMVGSGDEHDLTTQVYATEPLTEACPTSPNDTAVLIYTSGTTGRSKGVELTHFNLYSNAQYIPLWVPSDCPDKVRVLGKGHTVLAALPLFHSFGQTAMQNAPLMYGGTICYMPRWDAKAAMETIQRHKITAFAGVPTMYMSWLTMEGAANYDLSSLQITMSGGAPLPWPVFEQVKARFGIPLLQGYGLTETSPVVCFSKLWETIIPYSSGAPIWGVQVRIADEKGKTLEPGQEGEILVRGHNVMKGYYKRPQATAETIVNGWLHTGDIGKLDAGNNLFILDRKKELILRGGFNVYPAEVERVIFAHPDVLEVAVIGVPDDYLGEEVKAFVTLRDGAAVTEQDIMDYCKRHLAAYKYPRKVEFRPQLPKGPTGKIAKKELIAEEAARKAS
jgi:long-chain acyl-CoA synthetase